MTGYLNGTCSPFLAEGPTAEIRAIIPITQVNARSPGRTGKNDFQQQILRPLIQSIL